jgi:hypothetical protein
MESNINSYYDVMGCGVLLLAREVINLPWSCLVLFLVTM